VTGACPLSAPQLLGIRRGPAAVLVPVDRELSSCRVSSARVAPATRSLRWAPCVLMQSSTLGGLERDPNLGHQPRGQLTGVRSYRVGVYRIVYEPRDDRPSASSPSGTAAIAFGRSSPFPTVVMFHGRPVSPIPGYESKVREHWAGGRRAARPGASRSTGEGSDRRAPRATCRRAIRFVAQGGSRRS
jgi:hypothetical protein